MHIKYVLRPWTANMGDYLKALVYTMEPQGCEKDGRNIRRLGLWVFVAR